MKLITRIATIVYTVTAGKANSWCACIDNECLPLRGSAGPEVNVVSSISLVRSIHLLRLECAQVTESKGLSLDMTMMWNQGQRFHSRRRKNWFRHQQGKD
jgi:hypothetical protein